VDPETCCVRLKESIISKKSFASALEEQHTCTLKSPTIKNESYFKQISPTKSENSCKKSLLYLGGRYMIAQTIGSVVFS
jgi:hypothetical protein